MLFISIKTWQKIHEQGDKDRGVLGYQADDALQFIRRFTEITEALDCTEPSETI